ncbi:Bax inhibitor-1 family protein [Viridibacillus arvi]|uniref:Bax inhibitor-1 family protein n=1 Tax=Viridibacillus arvi TaxID=263475 RepID=UPI0034CFF324
MNSLQKFLFTFCMAFIVSGIGVIVGQFVPAPLMIPLMIAELVLLIILAFVRKKKFGYTLMYIFMFISGITLFVSLSHYVSVLGAGLVLKAFIVTAIAFIAIAIYGSVTKFNFGFLGNILFFVLLAIVILGIVSIFVTFSNTMHFVITIASILVFVGYTLYDFNQIARRGITEEHIPNLVISVYLDFINLFLSVLRLIKLLSRDD